MSIFTNKKQDISAGSSREYGIDGRNGACRAAIAEC